MENQHTQIRGYRDLSKEEIDLMNEIKAKGAELGALVEKLFDHTRQQQHSRRNTGIRACVYWMS